MSYLININKKVYKTYHVNKLFRTRNNYRSTSSPSAYMRSFIQPLTCEASINTFRIKQDINKTKFIRMKTVRLFFSIVLLSILAVSCERQYDGPPIEIPKYSREANVTVAKLKEYYASITNPTLIETDFVLKARVSANDVSGNVYKQIYIQDETGAINIGIDQNSIFTYYPVGQEVFLELKGLYMVKYGDELQIGFGNTQANRIPWEALQLHLHKSGWPDSTALKPALRTIGALTDKDVNTLVKFENIYFVNGGKNTFALADKASDEPIKDGAGKSIIVRTSNYASFAKTQLPSGSGDLTGILGRYRGTWQLIVRDKPDVGKFGGALPSNPGGTDLPPVNPNPPVGGDILNEPFSTSLGGFTEFSVTGAYVWKWASFTDKNTNVTDTYAKMTGYNSTTKTTEANEDWLISPAMDLSKVTTAALTFEHAVNYGSNMQTEQTLWISSDYNTGNPTAATWTQLTIPTYPAGKDFIFVSSGNIAIPAAFIGKANVRIAFKYTCGTANSATWEVRKVLVK